MTESWCLMDGECEPVADYYRILQVFSLVILDETTACKSYIITHQSAIYKYENRQLFLYFVYEDGFVMFLAALVFLVFHIHEM